MLAASKYVQTVSRPYPPLLADLIMRGYAEKRNYRGLLRRPFAYRDIVVRDDAWFYRATDQSRLSRNVLASWNTPSALRSAIRWLRSRERTLLRVARGNDFRRYTDAYEAYTPSLGAVFVIESDLLRRLRAALSARFDRTRVLKLLNTLNLPLRLNEYKREELDLVRTGDLARHVRQYAWIRSRYGIRAPYTVAQARRKKALLDTRTVLANAARQRRVVRRAIREAKAALPARDRLLVDIMQFIVYYRTHRADILNKSTYLFGETLARMAHQYGISYHQLLRCSRKEIEDDRINKRRIASRTKGFAVVLNGRNVNMLDGKAYYRVAYRFVRRVKTTDVLRGTCAAPGIVRGTARIIENPADFRKMRRGNVLVASMTTPEFVPIMNKASAFVTDEGGLTCHAAIIAREMKKPCVIGTRIATKILKDGDRVEVDATNGVVRKLP